MKVCEKHTPCLKKGVTYQTTKEVDCEVCNLLSLSNNRFKFILTKIYHTVADNTKGEIKNG